MGHHIQSQTSPCFKDISSPTATTEDQTLWFGITVVSTVTKHCFQVMCMASVKVSFIAARAAILLLSMLLQKIMVCASDHQIAPSPAMDTGSAFASSVSVDVAVFTVVLCVFGVLVN